MCFHWSLSLTQQAGFQFCPDSNQGAGHLSDPLQMCGELVAESDLAHGSTVSASPRQLCQGTSCWRARAPALWALVHQKQLDEWKGKPKGANLQSPEGRGGFLTVVFFSSLLEAGRQGTLPKALCVLSLFCGSRGSVMFASSFAGPVACIFCPQSVHYQLLLDIQSSA